MNKNSLNIETIPSYKKTKIGWIPDEWQLHDLGNLVSVKDGTHQTPTYTESGVPFLRVTDIVNGVEKNDGIKFISKKEHQELTKRTKPLRGDILYSKNGTIGVAKKITWDWEFSIFVSLALLKIKKTNLINVDFLEAWLNSVKAKKEIFRSSKQGTVTNLHLNEIKKFRIALPPLPEQKKIADILSTWDRAIETLEQLIAKKEELKKGLMQQLLTPNKSGQAPKKRFPEFEGEWKEVRFKDVVKIDAKSLNSKTSPDYEFEYISLSDVENGQISNDLEVYEFKDAPSRAKRIVSEDDILMATVRPNLQAYALAKKEHQGKIASTGLAVLTPNKNFNIKYLYHYLFSHHISGQFYALTVGSSYPAINSGDVKKLKIRLPSDQEEINKIESVLTNIDKEIKSIEKNKEMLMIQKKGLMQQLLTGKTRVKSEVT